MFPVVIVVLLVLSVPALAQSIYKCTQHGTTLYGDQPCSGGHVTTLALPAAPAPDPDAARSLQRQQALLARLEKQRHAREVREQRVQARIDQAAAVQARRCGTLRLQQKWTDEDLSRAVGDNKEALRKKARRQRQAMALECPG